MPLFRSTHDALRFAYNFNGTNITGVRIGDVPASDGKGLGGLDGAGEAGNIKRIVEEQSEWIRAVIESRYMPYHVPCNCGRACCKGWRDNLDWRRAVRVLSTDDGVVRTVFGYSGDVLYRFDVVGRYFMRESDRSSIQQIAVESRMPERTVRHHCGLLAKLFNGSDSNQGLYPIAFDTVDRAMNEHGIVGNVEK